MVMYNKSALRKLPKAQKSKASFEAMLFEYDIDGNKEKPVWTFLINPKELRFKESAKYNETTPIASPVAFLDYEGSTGATLTIPDLLMDTYCLGKSLKPLMDGLRLLLRSKTDSTNFSPMVLGFKWGSKRFAPCVLIDIDWTESRNLSGEPARINLSITLKEIPRPLTRAEKEAKEKNKQDILKQRRETAGKPRLALTKNQAKTASDAARNYLEANRSIFSPDIQSSISKGKYALKTDVDSGNVEMIVSGKSVGVVLKSLGEKIVTNSTILTVPLGVNEKAAEIK